MGAEGDDGGGNTTTGIGVVGGGDALRGDNGGTGSEVRTESSSCC